MASELCLTDQIFTPLSPVLWKPSVSENRAEGRSGHPAYRAAAAADKSVRSMSASANTRFDFESARAR